MKYEIIEVKIVKGNEAKFTSYDDESRYIVFETKENTTSICFNIEIKIKDIFFCLLPKCKIQP